MIILYYFEGNNVFLQLSRAGCIQVPCKLICNWAHMLKSTDALTNDLIFKWTEIKIRGNIF